MHCSTIIIKGYWRHLTHCQRRISSLYHWLLQRDWLYHHIWTTVTNNGYNFNTTGHMGTLNWFQLRRVGEGKNYVLSLKGRIKDVWGEYHGLHQEWSSCLEHAVYVLPRIIRVSLSMWQWCVIHSTLRICCIGWPYNPQYRTHVLLRACTYISVGSESAYKWTVPNNEVCFFYSNNYRTHTATGSYMLGYMCAVNIANHAPTFIYMLTSDMC